MRALGRILMIVGAAVGVAVALSMVAHLGVAGPWLVNVALAKLGFVASLALMAGGAVSARIAKRREQRELTSGAASRGR